MESFLIIKIPVAEAEIFFQSRYNNLLSGAFALLRSYRESLDKSVLVNSSYGGDCHYIIAADGGDKFSLCVVDNLNVGYEVLSEGEFILKEHIYGFTSVYMIFLTTSAVRAVVAKSSLRCENVCTRDPCYAPVPFPPA